MARIPEDELLRIKREVDLAALVRAKGVDLKPHGENLIGLCPFHDDKNPSLVVTPKKHLWHCLGACQAGGSVIDWVMKTEGISFRHAAERLRRGKMEDVITSVKILKAGSIRKLPSPVETAADDRTLLAQVVDYYHETLKQTPEALDYLVKRGIRDEEAMLKFKLGYADRTLGLRLPTRSRLAGEAIRSRLTALGIYRGSGHEHFNGSLIIPILDEEGGVLGIYGRKITDHLRPGTANHLYLPGPHRGVWNSSSLAAQDVILCEALIDALTFWVSGFRNVTTSYGVEGFTEAHRAAFVKYAVRRVYIAYDRDEAGDRAAGKLSETLRNEGLECFRVELPRGMDVNAYALKMQPAQAALRLALNSAVWLGRGKRPEGVASGPPTGPGVEGVKSPIETVEDIPTEVRGEEIGTE